MLSVADLRLVSTVAGRRSGVAVPPLPDEVLAAAVAEQDPAQSAHVRAARLAAAVLSQPAVPAAALQTALLVMHCSLSLDGLSLLAPQGVVAGMVRALATPGGPDEVARWLEDRAVPASGGG